ncbi:hypothetical protein OQA88_10734 [Cercophora sp. LCS_1]
MSLKDLPLELVCMIGAHLDLPSLTALRSTGRGLHASLGREFYHGLAHQRWQTRWSLNGVDEGDILTFAIRENREDIAIEYLEAGGPLVRRHTDRLYHRSRTCLKPKIFDREQASKKISEAGLPDFPPNRPMEYCWICFVGEGETQRDTFDLMCAPVLYNLFGASGPVLRCNSGYFLSCFWEVARLETDQDRVRWLRLILKHATQAAKSCELHLLWTALYHEVEWFLAENRSREPACVLFKELLALSSSLWEPSVTNEDRRKAGCQWWQAPRIACSLLRLVIMHAWLGLTAKERPQFFETLKRLKLAHRVSSGSEGSGLPFPDELMLAKVDRPGSLARMALCLEYTLQHWWGGLSKNVGESFITGEFLERHRRQGAVMKKEVYTRVLHHGLVGWSLAGLKGALRCYQHSASRPGSTVVHQIPDFQEVDCLLAASGLQVRTHAGYTTVMSASEVAASRS